MSEDDLRRSNDVAIARQEQRFEDFLNEYRKNEERADVWRKHFESRFQPIEDAFKFWKRPSRFLVWMVITAISVPVIEVGRYIAAFFSKHFH